MAESTRDIHRLEALTVVGEGGLAEWVSAQNLCGFQ